MKTAKIGQGFSLPLRVNASKGLATSSGDERIRESIIAILGVQPGERVMRPEYGANLRSLVFAPNNAATANLAQFHIEDALARWEPRVAVEEVRVDNSEYEGRGALRVSVAYRLKSSGELQNLEFNLPLE